MLDEGGELDQPQLVRGDGAALPRRRRRHVRARGDAHAAHRDALVARARERLHAGTSNRGALGNWNSEAGSTAIS